MLNGCLNHTEREEGLIQGFQSLMECKIYYQKSKDSTTALGCTFQQS